MSPFTTITVKQYNLMADVIRAAWKLKTLCNHKPEGWDELDNALKELKAVKPEL